MSLFEETKRKVSLAAGLWGAAPLLCCRAWRECWLLDFPTSKKFQERGSLQNDGFGVVWAAESLVFESQTDLAELYKGCWLLGFAAWPWHVAQCLLYSIDAPYPWIRVAAVPLCPRDSPQIQHMGCHMLLGLDTAFLVLG